MSENDPFFNPSGRRYSRGRGVLAAFCCCIVFLGLVALVIIVALNPGEAAVPPPPPAPVLQCSQFVDINATSQNVTQQCGANFTTGVAGHCQESGNSSFSACLITNFFLNQSNNDNPHGVTSCTVPIAACSQQNCAL